MATFSSYYLSISITAATLLISAGQSAATNKLTLINTLQIDRPDELIILKRSDIERKIGRLASGMAIAINDPQKKDIALQYDDLNKDGKWDELAFLYTFRANEEADFTIKITRWQDKEAKQRAHVRLHRKNKTGSYGPVLLTETMPYRQPANDFNKTPIPLYQTEGPAWENDKVGFRLYLDVRNGKDLFGKTTTKMVMDTVGVEGDIYYHKQAPWGMDILKVGKSLGAGALAFSLKYKGRDTLVRLGGDNIATVNYQSVADGPIRAIFKLTYPNVKLLPGLAAANITEQITIWGGQYFYESQISTQGLPEDTKLVTGIVNLHSKEVTTLDTADCKLEYTYDVQSENNDKLGMGIIVRNKYFKSFGTTTNEPTSDIQHTYTVTEQLSALEPTPFRFYFGWEPSDHRFTTRNGFDTFMKQESTKYSANIIQKW